jgi:NAD(P)H-hydrate epimerase
MITTKEMKELEDMAEQIGISREELMENAGRRVVEALDNKFGEELAQKKILVVCGQGNNGGDGFVIARLLSTESKVTVLFLGVKERLSPEALTNYESLEDIDKNMIIKHEDELFATIKLNEFDIIIDAMLGTGVQGPLQYPYSGIVRDINHSKPFVVSVDVPTGVDPDTGKCHADLFVDADMIVTFHDTKPGLKKFKDKVIVADIGIP